MSSIFWSLPGWLSQDRIQGDWWALDPLSGPPNEPVTLEDVKRQARADGNTRDDVSFGGLLVAARRTVERYTNRSLLPQSWRFSCQNFPMDRIYLPMGAPLRGVTSFTWTGIDEITRDVDPGVYDINLSGDPGSVVLEFGRIWPPDPLSPSAPVRIEFQAGYDYFSGIGTISDDGLVLSAGGSPITSFNPSWPMFSTIVLNGISSLVLSVSPDGSFLTLMSPRADLVSTTGIVNWAFNLVPQDLKTAIMMLVTHWYGPGRAPVVVGRGVTSADISLGVRSLMDPYRVSVMGFRQTRGIGVPLLP